MNFPNAIIDLNNKAVAAILEGNCNGAITVLGSALSNLQQYRDIENAARAHLQQQQQQSPMVPPPASSPQQQHQHQQLQQLPSQQQQQSLAAKLLACMNLCGESPICSIPLPLNSDDNTSDCCGTFTVFNHAMTISNSAGLANTTVSKSYDRFLAMLLYNMALSFHTQALRSGKSEELRGALELYEMSFSVVESAWSLFDVDDLMLLLMALFNNLGHIHSSLYNTRQIQVCVDWLKCLAGHPAFLKLMQRDQYAHFSLNLLVVLKQQPQCSPAA